MKNHVDTSDLAEITYGIPKNSDVIIKNLKIGYMTKWLFLSSGAINKKNYETYNRSERKQVFTSNSKFQRKRFGLQVTYRKSQITSNIHIAII